ncbi:peptide/nickel transport system substrate-binding protein [Pseudonocardia oroxyli]|uniref:Peptide/nickel transport system substrate-binding protein n=1 Tax=Pseudonocardia oroxyli TaxID=366584 RepID=A0A1G7TRW8_PSEOR|nr:peptide/nickel transport system substrate-binding protein [Pseudonocardia oroxyli]
MTRQAAPHARSARIGEVRRRRSRPRRWSATLATALAVVLLSAGCAGGVSSGGSGDAPGGPPRSGGALTLLNQTETQAVSPFKMQIITATRGDGVVGFSLYGGLVLQDPATGDVSMSLAESLDSTDSLNWTLRLRPGLVFSDGTPFDAAAVKLNWERHGAPETTSSSLAQVKAIASTTVVDARTLRVTLAAPNGQWPRALAGNTINFIVSPSSIDTADTAPVGAGPFTLKEWVRDDHMTLVRNPKYFDAPRPYLDQLVVRPIPDAGQRYNGLVSGQGQIEFNSADFESLAQATEAGYTTYTSKLSGGIAFVLNNSRAPFNDVRVRRAVMLGLDVALLNDLVQGGRAEVTKTISAPGTPFYDPAIAYPATDRAQAQQLLDQVSGEKGGPVTFTILVNPQNRTTAEGIQTLLSEYRNIAVSVKVMDSTQSTVVQGDYDMGVSGNFFVDPEPKIYDSFHTGNPRNVSRYSNPTVDAALEKGRSSQDESERKAAYEIVQKGLIDDAATLSLWRIPSSLTHDDTVRDVSTIEDGVLRTDLVWTAK